MKKYWPVLSLVVISIVGLSFYYIDMAMALNKSQQFEFETVEGDDQYLNNLIFETGYYEDRLYDHYIVTKDSAEKFQVSELAYEQNYEMLQVFNEHKNFFRAKQLTGRHYYNDEQVLAYVYIDDQYNYDNPGHVLYKVDRLNKKTDTRETLDITASVNEPYAWQTVEWVTHVDDTLKVLSIRTHQFGKESVILTTFDLQKGHATEKVIVESIKNLHFAFHHYSSAYNRAQTVAFSHFNNDLTEGLPTETLYQFNASSEQLQEIGLPEDKDDNGYIYDVSDKYITASKEEDGEIRIQHYDVSTNKWDRPYNIPLIFESDLVEPRTQLIHDKLYVLYEVKKGYVIEIVDINSHKKLYAGLLTVKDQPLEHSLTVFKVHNVK